MISDWRHETAIEVFVLEHHVDVNDDPRSILVNGKAQLGGYTDKNNGTSHATPREVFEVNEVNSRSIFFFFSILSSRSLFSLYSNYKINLINEHHRIFLLPYITRYIYQGTV